MRHRNLLVLGALAAVVLAVVFVTGNVRQTAGPQASNNWTPPRTSWGDPDLQGTWNNGTITPLERPNQQSGREFLTEEEVAAANQEAATRADRRDPVGTEADVALAYNAFWWDRGKSIGRTSLIVDPPDGRIPYRAETKPQPAAPGAGGASRADSWLDRSLQERCLVYRLVPPLPTGYNNNYEIVQTPNHVAILQEQIHETRIIPLDRRPHLSQNLRQWLGDSRGHWEGNTLVVETTNFTDKTNFRGARKNLQVIERFTRIADDSIDYQFTVSDPGVWTRPWTAVLPWKKSDGELYEYACHEGNYGMVGILSGARAEEKVGAKTPNKD